MANIWTPTLPAKTLDGDTNMYIPPVMEPAIEYSESDIHGWLRCMEVIGEEAHLPRKEDRPNSQYLESWFAGALANQKVPVLVLSKRFDMDFQPALISALSPIFGSSNVLKTTEHVLADGLKKTAKKTLCFIQPTASLSKAQAKVLVKLAADSPWCNFIVLPQRSDDLSWVTKAMSHLHTNQVAGSSETNATYHTLDSKAIYGRLINVQPASDAPYSNYKGLGSEPAFVTKVNGILDTYSNQGWILSKHLLVKSGCRHDELKAVMTDTSWSEGVVQAQFRRMDIWSTSRVTQLRAQSALASLTPDEIQNL